MTSRSGAAAERQAREAALEKLRARAREREEAVADAVVRAQLAHAERERLAGELTGAEEVLAAAVLELADLGQSQESIADLTGLPISTVRAARRAAAAPSPRAERAALVPGERLSPAAVSVRLDGETRSVEAAS